MNVPQRFDISQIPSGHFFSELTSEKKTQYHIIRGNQSLVLCGYGYDGCSFEDARDLMRTKAFAGDMDAKQDMAMFQLLSDEIKNLFKTNL